jgi:hypothetical protein
MINPDFHAEPQPVFTVETDFGYPIVMCTLQSDDKWHWYQLWVLSRNQTLLDKPFENFRPEVQDHATQVPLRSIFGGHIYRKFDEDRLDELVQWINERDALWSVRACDVPPQGVSVSRSDPDTLPFEFSFSSAVVATEFKLRWG